MQPVRTVSSPCPSVLIVGGGVFGVAAALELRSHGVRVTLIEADTIPRDVAASTDISKVVRMDYGGDEAYTAWGEEAIVGWRDWNRRFRETLFHETGFLVMRRDAMQPGGFEHDSFHLLTGRGHKLERLKASDMAARFPAWRHSGHADGYFNPTGGWAASGQVMRHLAKAAKESGVIIREHTAFHRLLETGSKIVGVQTDSGERLTADVTIIAAGAWTPALLPELQGVLRVTGQPVFHVKVDDPKPWQPLLFPVWAADIARTGWYGFPALDDGTLKVANHGSGRTVKPDELRIVLPEEIDHCRQFLAACLPEAAHASLMGTRLCLYCDSFDGHFLIDHHPQRSGLIVAAGDSGHAFKFAPVIGQAIASAVLGLPHPLKQRFAWRNAMGTGAEGARAG